jgi:hypothetical protein
MTAAVMIFRIFAVLAAALLVGAFSLAVLTPDGMSLDQGVLMLEPTLVSSVRHLVQHTIGAAAWTRLFMPLLVRPVWLIPLCLGMICAGVAASVGTPTESPRRTRTRG